MIRLENWAITPMDNYSPPEAGMRLQGNVYGSPNFNDGDKIATSRVVAINKEERSMTTVHDSIYYLGKMDPEYLNMYPNAEEIIWGE